LTDDVLIRQLDFPQVQVDNVANGLKGGGGIHTLRKQCLQKISTAVWLEMFSKTVTNACLELRRKR